MKRVHLRIATVADIPILKQWDEQPHVMAADPNDDWEWDIELAADHAWRQQLMAELDGEPLGFVQIIDPAEEASHYWGEVPANLRAIDIWIGPPEFLGKGYGTQMMLQALALCFAEPAVTAVLIDPLASNLRAIKFYRRLGFEFVASRSFDGDACEVYQYTRARWNQAKTNLAEGA